jgi:prepilin-type N-terminal cleavage/methylation domain-containing protein/prepilin-type processing-associated H-X9-DG protein
MFTRLRKSGFTLIELLVVIALIALLAAILFPVFAQIRGNADAAVCKSNLKQIGTAWMMYCEDYDERTPLNWWTNTYCGSNQNNGGDDPPRGAMPVMFWRVQPYLKHKDVLICPSDGSPMDTIDSENGPNFCDRIKLSYSSSDEAGALGQGLGSLGQAGIGLGLGVSLSGIQYPASMYLAFDSQRYHGTPEDNIDSFGWMPQDDGGNEGPGFGTGLNADFVDRHNGTVNCAFCDGHVKALHCNDMFPCERGEWIGGAPGTTKPCWNSGWTPTYTNENGINVPKNQCP